MSFADPTSAPGRPDLVFLRRRTRPKVEPSVVLPQSVDDSSPTGTHPMAPPSDVQSTAGVQSTAPPSADSGNLLDLSTPGDTALDLSTDSVATSAVVDDAPSSIRPTRRANSADRTILTPDAPTVTLTRLQSGVGMLTVEAACTDAVGDLRFGCAYTLRGGVSSTLAPTSGRIAAPPNSNAPAISGINDGRGKFTIDLRQCRDVDRLVIYGYSDAGNEVPWSGTLVVTTFANARIEIPLDRMPAGNIGVVMSLYNVHGEFVLRAEMCPIDGSVQQACRAYGFDRITWVDDRTPLH
ncbi:hypothetical protein BFN03_11835 [Rhodococcus sp. WMMA185]|uniref:hypothetical protein n=1 Tax=Rhodococcus sp. WMMA185 TaxID=679318 RepID=UPI00087817A8|nr:hypothetical protein [Rhodococcus sp. WMMA185]AOW93107.1 hypothetical protein BFN03_11835 [Rhodococcus sp. WMMA185]